jgi:RNA polymerase sigma-70 factor, ECF subfamily
MQGIAMARPDPTEPPPPAEPAGDRRRAQGGSAATGEGEAALVERARRGDARAFRALVERHQDRAYAVALRITRSPAEAAEAAHEGLVRAWRALPGFRGESAFGTWLHRVVARRALDRALALESRRDREAGCDEAAGEPDDAGPARDPLLARRLERLLGLLSPAQRAAVTLFYLEDLPVAEVAGALRMPENTVKTHLHRARAALRAAWIREGGEP